MVSHEGTTPILFFFLTIFITLAFMGQLAMVDGFAVRLSVLRDGGGATRVSLVAYQRRPVAPRRTATRTSL